jgi:2'-5' RNA ligase
LILRTFIAIELEEPLRVAVGQVQAQLKRQMPPGSVRWVAPEAMHLTLKFLGDTSTSRIRAIVDALTNACAGFPPFTLTLAGRGCFPNVRRPQVVWVGIHDSGRMLARMQDSVEKHVAPLGWPREPRGFTPHLTLGRVVRDASAETAAHVGEAVTQSVVETIGAQVVSAVHLIQSDLRPSGPVYKNLASVRLAE